ncbi:MAG: hypothetical protein JWO32_2363 [Bacteroidetes bacterium]|nr:hypothetical protein [Bacteroidota bacterium]
METKETFFDTWTEVNSNMLNNWKKTISNIKQDREEAVNMIRKLNKTCIDNYNKLIQHVWGNFSSDKMNIPFFSVINNETKNPGEDVLDRLKDVHELLNQYNVFTYSLINTFINSMYSIGPEAGNFLSFDSVSKKHPHIVSRWYIELLNTYQKSLNPFYNFNNYFSLTDPRICTSQAETINKYQIKASRMQFILSNTSLIALEKLTAEIYQRIINNKQIPNNEEFYNEWLAVNEKEFALLFHTEEYVMLQEDLVSLHSEICKMNEKQLEGFLKPLPITLKSDLEEIHKLNQDLRTRISKLENEMV